MPYFNFIAKDQHGRNYSGNLYGASEQAVFFRLQKLGYVVLSVTEKEPKEQLLLFPPKVTMDDIVIFSRLLSTVIETGLPAVDALAALEEQTENITFKRVIKRIREDVERGETLSSAFSRHPKVFPHFFVSMIKSGEAGGNLPEVLEHLCQYMEKDHDLRRNIRSAFTYPKFIMTMMAGLMFILFYKVFPVLNDFYAQAPDNVKIPKATKILMSGCAVVFENWQFVLAGLGFLVSGFIFFKTSIYTRQYYDKLMIMLPLLGPINRRITVTRCLRTLGSMLHCGVPLLTSLECATTLTNNFMLEKDLTNVIQSVEEGGTMSSPLRLSTTFPPVAIYMISVGEHSGRLPDLLRSCADAMDKEIDHLIKQLLIALEPALIVIIAIIVAFIAIALYLPVFSSLLQMT